MRTRRGDYDGASEFAYFKRPVQEMDLAECRSLLECILHRAMPGEDNAAVVYRALEIAERCMLENAPARRPRTS